MRALLCMRLEKNFPTWYRELRPIYGGFEAGMDRFIDLTKNDFIGREAAMEEKRTGGKLRRVSMIVDAADADVLMHAITDAVLGAIAEGDIGAHFPPSDPQWKGAPSAIFLRRAVQLLHARGGIVANADVRKVYLGEHFRM